MSKKKQPWRARIYKEVGDETGKASFWTTEKYANKRAAVAAANRCAQLLYKKWKAIGVQRPKKSIKSDGSVEFILVGLKPDRWPRAEAMAD